MQCVTNWVTPGLTMMSVSILCDKSSEGSGVSPGSSEDIRGGGGGGGGGGGQAVNQYFVHILLLVNEQEVHVAPYQKLFGDKKYTVLLFCCSWGTRGTRYSYSEASWTQEEHGTPILKLLGDNRYTVLLF